MGITMERTGSLPIQLADVKEERNKDIEEEYFGKCLQLVMRDFLMTNS